ncbi:MAG: tetratricopeptide repeat protein [Caulobacter sp.]|nr:tetratricopeptide repeat protein [Caulobacter sp.]
MSSPTFNASDSPHPFAAGPRMVAPVAGEAGSHAALARIDAAVAELKALAIQPLLQRAVAALLADDFVLGGDLAMQALNTDERSGMAWYLMAIARERAGDFAMSLRCYESALALIPEEAEVANDLGRLAYRMGMVETAEKLFRHYLAAHPDSHEAANNLACALRDQALFAEAIDVLSPAIAANPDKSLLWNTLGTVVGEQGDPATSSTFFDEALRIDPGMSKARYNRGNARLVLGDAAGAHEDVQAALAETTDVSERLMMQLSRSTIRLVLGDTAGGWDDYEARLHPQFGDVTHFICESLLWTPEVDLAGKTLLVYGEQGLGDEAMFAGLIPDVIEALGPDGKLILAVEGRLVPLFQRSFPAAEVGPHRTGMIEGRTYRGAEFVTDASAIDLWSPMGSLLRRFRTSVEAFPPHDGYLKPDPARVAHWRAQLAALPGPKVGLLWKSAISNGARHRFFSPFEQWAPVLATPGVTFVNLQYGDCALELAEAKKHLGLEIWNPPGIDLKADLDDVAALCRAMDLIVGPANATSSIAGACGAPIWILSTPGSWTRLGTDHLPWYPQARVFVAPGVGQWEEPMQDIAEALSQAVTAGTGAFAKG